MTTGGARHVPGLDGLRGLAVMAVMACHAGIPRAAGGVVGVDVFFVLSGFLITGIVLDQLESGRFDLLRFYRRRLFRIAPALWCMLGLLSLATLLVNVPWKSGIFWRATAFAAPFATQAQLLRHEDAGPLSHLWSLSVEAAFYLMWPIALVAAHRLHALRPLLIATGFVVIASMALRYAVFMLGWQGNPWLVGVAVTRADGIFAGAALCCLLRRFHGHDGLLSLAAYVLPVALIGTLISIKPAISAMGWACLFAVATASCLVAAAATIPKHPVVRLLESRPLRWTGEISYGLYLWHLPVEWCVKSLRFSRPAHWLVFAMVSLGLAAASFYLIERRFLARR